MRSRTPLQKARARRDAAHRIEMLALQVVEHTARAYSRHSHGGLHGDAYRDREEDRDRLLDALAQLDESRNVSRLG